jgi:hypothetical protein
MRTVQTGVDLFDGRTTGVADPVRAHQIRAGAQHGGGHLLARVEAFAADEPHQQDAGDECAGHRVGMSFVGRAQMQRPLFELRHRHRPALERTHTGLTRGIATDRARNRVVGRHLRVRTFFAVRAGIAIDELRIVGAQRRVVDPSFSGTPGR